MKKMFKIAMLVAAGSVSLGLGTAAVQAQIARMTRTAYVAPVRAVTAFDPFLAQLVRVPAPVAVAPPVLISRASAQAAPATVGPRLVRPPFSPIRRSPFAPSRRPGDFG